MCPDFFSLLTTLKMYWNKIYGSPPNSVESRHKYLAFKKHLVIYFNFSTFAPTPGKLRLPSSSLCELFYSLLKLSANLVPPLASPSREGKSFICEGGEVKITTGRGIMNNR